MNNTFTFHGVGQGLFYSGSIDDKKFNFIYDCGGSTEKLRNEIENLEFDEIDFLVISHLHEDHINGLPILLQSKKVNKIFLPYFDTANYLNVFKALLITNKITPDTELYNLILQLYSVENPKDKIINEEHIFPITNCNWQFNFYNRSIPDTTLKKLQEDLQNLLGGEGVKTVEEYFEKEYKNPTVDNKPCEALKTIFKKIHKDHNLSSIVLMHWDKSGNGEKTLLTGDAKFDKDLQCRVFGDIESDRIILQAPHHGAHTEWTALWNRFATGPDTNKIKSQVDKFVFSYGTENSYHHPYGKILVELLEEETTPDKIIFVHENKPYQY